MDVDQQVWSSTLSRNHDENKTYILVKLSESFSNAIQEYSAAVARSAVNHQSSLNNHHQNHNNRHSNYQDGGLNIANNNPSTQAPTVTHTKNNHKRPKLNHNSINSATDNNYDNNTKQNQLHQQHNSQQISQPIEAPTIRFLGTRGAIKFPNGKSYDFSLEQSDNSVECIRQIKSKWESVGKMACCLHVKGKDDVYQRTRTKMEAAEQEKRKYCTKLLGSPEHQNQTSQNLSSSQNSNNNTNKSSNKHHHNYNNHHNHHNHHHHNNNNNSHLHHQQSQLLQQQQQQQHLLDLKSSSASSSSASSSSCSSSSSANNNYNSSVNGVNNSSSTTVNSNNNNSSSSSSTTSNINSIRYPDITDIEQFKKYKAEFDKDFKEYQTLHGYLHRIEERFRKLRESLKQNVEGSPEWESFKEQIFNEYERVKGDSNFHKARSKYKLLYNKLAHIKAKIFQFKKQQKDKCNNNKTKIIRGSSNKNTVARKTTSMS